MTDPYVTDFHLVSQEMPKVYRDNDPQFVAVIPHMKGYIQRPQESVSAYGNRLKADWRQAGWNLQKHKGILYDVAWAGFHNSLKFKVRLMTPTRVWFDTLDKFFDNAVASEVTHVENKKPLQRQHKK